MTREVRSLCIYAPLTCADMCSECLCTTHLTVVDIRLLSGEVPSILLRLSLSLYPAATPSSSPRSSALDIRHAFSVVVDVRAHDGEGFVALNKDSRPSLSAHLPHSHTPELRRAATVFGSSSSGTWTASSISSFLIDTA
jgi:hypothetical protein